MEKQSQVDIKRAQKREAREDFELFLAATYAAIIAFLTRYGAPRIEEPLWRACKRVEKSAKRGRSAAECFRLRRNKWATSSDPIETFWGF